MSVFGFLGLGDGEEAPAEAHKTAPQQVTYRSSEVPNIPDQVAGKGNAPAGGSNAVKIDDLLARVAVLEAQNMELKEAGIEIQDLWHEVKTLKLPATDTSL